MSAYYNEHDPFAAAWLRELIRERHIADGEVDQRDIRDVAPDDLAGFVQCHFFAGIGVWSHALRRAGWPDERPVWTGSCPCQPFSAAGKRGGTSDERHLWPSWFHLIAQQRPAIVFGEQVASKDGLGWLDLVHTDLEGADYSFGAADLCAAGVGSPHIRQRLWFVAERGLEHSAHDRQFERELGDEAGAQRSTLSDQHVQFANQGRGRYDAADASFAGGLALSDSRQRDRLADGQGRVSDGPQAGRQQGDGEPQRSGPDGRLADPLRDGAWNGSRQGLGTEAAPLGEDGDLPRERLRPRIESASDNARRPGPVNGIWRDADWLFCRDGKWRPVEPGTFPLAHGAPARVGRLRGYGNAIVAEAAATFIQSYLEVRAAA